MKYFRPKKHNKNVIWKCLACKFRDFCTIYYLLEFN